MGKMLAAYVGVVYAVEKLKSSSLYTSSYFVKSLRLLVGYYDATCPVRKDLESSINSNIGMEHSKLELTYSPLLIPSLPENIKAHMKGLFDFDILNKLLLNYLCSSDVDDPNQQQQFIMFLESIDKGKWKIILSLCLLFYGIPYPENFPSLRKRSLTRKDIPSLRKNFPWLPMSALMKLTQNPQ